MVDVRNSNEKERLVQINQELLYSGIESFPIYKGFQFERRNRYWSVNALETTDGFPIDIATEMHEKKYPYEMYDNCGIQHYGSVIRVAGHAGAPHPKNDNCLWADDGYITCYHIDTQEGLNEFARVLNKLR